MFILALTLAASAVADNRTTMIYEFPGSDSCGDWTLNRQNAGRRTQALEGWVLGFVSGYNQYRDPTGDVAPGTSATALLAWVDGYCASHPLDNVAQAGMKLVAELRQRRRQ